MDLRDGATPDDRQVRNLRAWRGQASTKCSRAADADQATRASAADVFRVRSCNRAGRRPRIFARPLGRQSRNALEVLAATWIPDPTLAAQDGFVASEFLWSALDCPTGYASS
jgi:hypothetical protein